MISLVIISLVVAAFTPVITKKMQNKTTSGSTQNPDDMDDETIAELKAKTADMFLPFDAVAGKTQTTTDGGYFKCAGIVKENYSNNYKRTIKCKIKVPSDHVSIVMVGGGAGGGGGQNGNTNTYSTRPTSNSILNLTQDTTNPRLSFRGKRADAGYGVFEIDTEEIEKYIKNCPEGTVEVMTGSGDKFCVTKYNLRPEQYEDYHFNYADKKRKVAQSDAMTKEFKVNLAEGTFLTDSGTNSEYTYIQQNKSPVCWVSSTKCAGQYGDYPVCGRTVCNHWAAELMCPQLDLGGNTCSDDGINFNKPCKGRWRLMTYKEVAKPANKTYFGSEAYLYNIAKNTLYPFLNENLKYSFHTCGGDFGEVYCGAIKSACEGTDSSACSPGVAWAESKNEEYAYSFYAYTQYLSTGGNSRYLEGTTSKGAGGSVRCVLQKSSARPVYTYITGGNGGEGARIITKIPKEIVDYCINNECWYSKYTDSTGSYSSNAQLLVPGSHKNFTVKDGKAGDAQYVLLKTAKENGSILWGYKVEGGRGGKGATLDTPGEASEEADLCYKYESDKWSEGFVCSLDANTALTKGTSGQKGKIVTFKQKTATDLYDKIVSTEGIETIFKPGEIKTGNVTTNWQETGVSDVWYYYDTIGAGRAAGGGGGGAFAHIKDIPITPNKEYEIIIGGGGQGGEKSSGGSCYTSYGGFDGADTTIYLDSNTILTAGGGKGANDNVCYNETKAKRGYDGGKFEVQTDSPVIQSIMNDKTKTIKADGGKGEDSIKEKYQGIGGSGGLSGISIATRIIANSIICGGLNKAKDSGCSNENNVNAFSPLKVYNQHAPVNHIYLDGNYGSYGAGGGGGGWRYENEKYEAGNGSAGQDGYVYFYWNK